MKRVVIIGGSGSGKTTLACQIGKQTNIPVTHLDKFFFNPGWVERDRAKFNNDVFAEFSKPSWVMDGNFISSLPDRLVRADTFILLDFPAHIRLWRVILRMLKTYGKVRPDMAVGCPEGFDWKFLKWVVFYKRRGDRDKALRFLKTAPKNVATYHLKSRAEVKEFLKHI